MRERKHGNVVVVVVVNDDNDDVDNVGRLLPINRRLCRRRDQVTERDRVTPKPSR